jgi:hypothetical protein
VAPPPTTTSVAPTTSVSPPDVAPPSDLATSGLPSQAKGTSIFGDQGDWRPSLYVSDVPEIAYFDPAEMPDVPGADSSVPLPFGKPG